MKKLLILFLWIGSSQSIFVLAQSGFEKRKLDPQEKRKIEFLLAEIEKLNGAKFWRNGSAYPPDQAVDYLRMKLRWNDNTKPIKTARDFIERVASKSAITGKVYQIQLPDGTKMEMRTFLYQKLSEWKE